MYRTTKRVLDFFVSASLLIISAPIQAAVAVGVSSTMGRPVLFRQKRVGFNGKEFNLLKFRTMIGEHEVPAGTPPSARITRLGRVLRSTSIDELPSLLNVLRGDMSLVGPRPLPTRYLGRYSAHQARRHEVSPGITGLAQVAGRNLVDWPERFDLDVKYVDQLSMTLDLKILLRTMVVVLRRTGVNSDTGDTMREFIGSEDKTC